ncbi:DUF559 domain-containing protein [Citricoccus nitrophenolicus]|uniref:Uncharacterized protein DUF559 n=1 Tax=Citricoccus muralis TaxID=169134 RepID=A0A3D9LF99_9MICC|nr:DUF559 domain-containing protein [Citricoccus muralis]REE04097.1 uncharacterized protein DUF559 [Citricoccus muralis]
MVHRRALPEPLQHTPFTRAEARRHGVSRKRLEARDIVRLGHGLLASSSVDTGWPAGFAEPGHGMGRLSLAALARQFPDAVYSHGTAALVFRLPLPDIVASDRTIHLTWCSGTGAAQRKGITAHRSPVPEEDRVQFRRLPLTSPARTWVDMASLLDLTDLIILGDAIVNRPWDQDRRVDGLATLAGLSDALLRAGSVKGVRDARVALARCRVGADSPPETLTRLALVDAGLPEPVVQLKGDPSDRFAPAADLGYRNQKIAIQYDGKHHRTASQQASDAYRDAWFQERGWLVIRLTSLDLGQGFSRLIQVVRRRFEAHGNSATA